MKEISAAKSGFPIVGASATLELMLNGDEKNKRIDKG